MTFKLTVMGKPRDAPNAFPPKGSLMLFPISPPVRVGNFLTMPPIGVAQWGTDLDGADMEALAHQLGVKKHIPYVPPSPDDLVIGGPMPRGHVVWPYDANGSRHELYKLEETGILILIYFLADQPRLRLGIAGEEIEVDCAWATGSVGLAAAMWDGAIGRMSLMYCAYTPDRFQVAAKTNDDDNELAKMSTVSLNRVLAS